METEKRKNEIDSSDVVLKSILNASSSIEPHSIRKQSIENEYVNIVSKFSPNTIKEEEFVPNKG